MRKILHPEGRRIVGGTILMAALLAAFALYFLPRWIGGLLVVAILLAVLFVCRFFRVPRRCPAGCGAEGDGGGTVVLAPADGTVVAIEEVYEDEVLNERRIQVSIFMSVWNVHINWFPVTGVVEYFRYHPGRFLVAWHPKSSTDNERTTTVVRTGGTGAEVEGTGVRILFRQIAGFVARRIVSYATEGKAVERGTECGFIKFGSRVDLFLPLGSEICVGLGDRTVGTRTVIARLPENGGRGASTGDNNESC